MASKFVSKDGTTRECIVIEDDSNDVEPEAPARSARAPPSSGHGKRRVTNMQLDPVKVACLDANMKDRELRGVLEERMRILKSESMLLDIRTTEFKAEKTRLMSGLSMRMASHMKQVAGTTLIDA
jgi:hypothetical protein